MKKKSRGTQRAESRSATDKASRIIFVDFENVQRINLDTIKQEETQVLLFVGRHQNKIPFELVRDGQFKNTSDHSFRPPVRRTLMQRRL